MTNTALTIVLPNRAVSAPASIARSKSSNKLWRASAAPFMCVMRSYITASSSNPWRPRAPFRRRIGRSARRVPVIFSAHGVPKSVPAEASRRGLTFFDATCPLVSKVHLEPSATTGPATM